MKKNYHYIISVMRISVIALTILAVCSFVGFSKEVKGQLLNKKIPGLSFKTENLMKVLGKLEKDQGLKFAFDEQELGLLNKQTKTLKFVNVRLQEVFEKLFTPIQIAYHEYQGIIYLSKLPKILKPGRISGKVLDDKGESLPGASIRVIETAAGTQTAVDGSYILNLQPGTYTLEISYMSYQTRRITGAIVTEGKNTALDIAMKSESKGLKELVITANYSKASAEGLLTRQKNAAELSNGISAEQIARTPDKNIGESLKRISGVSSVDNKFILVRGIGERYNSAMLDGTVLPSTEAQSRNFSFDLIPSNLVDNVVVSKTVTPDMNASFGGGLIQINTKDIPNENFMSFSAGVSYNDQSTGKDFLSRKRGKYDYLGFDDGRRDYPKGLVHTEDATREVTDAQSRKFTNDNFTVYHTKTAPAQNYQFTMGRLLALDTTKNNKLGFTGSLSYRNTQNINIIDRQNRTSSWDEASTNNTGKAYGFNTTFGGLLNAGLQLGKNRFSFRNTYTRMFDNTFIRTIGFTDDDPQVSNPAVTSTRIQEVDDPTFTDLLQNKLSGQHQLGKVRIDWDAARTAVNREEKDLGIAESTPRLLGKEYQYFYYVGNNTEPRIEPVSRHHYHNKEQHYSWNLSATVPFTLGDVRSTVKTGYFGNQKKASFDWQIAALTAGPGLPDSLNYVPIGEMIKPENIGGVNGFQYTVSPFWLDAYEGKSRTHAGYIMFDNRLMEKLRLVWGIRGEYYKYTEIQNGVNEKLTIYSIKPDRHWQWLPSANLTYSLTDQVNVRAAFSSSVVRPELMDNSQFWRYSPYLGAQLGSEGLYSTRINSWDFKTEWFPGLGEIISIAGFYKNFDKPAELTISTLTSNINYYLKSSDWAKVYGLEFELRKNFGFLADNRIWNNLTAYGNLTLQKSEVRSTYLVANPDPAGPALQVPSKQTRPMYGQTPYLINAGLQYTGDQLGLNLAYNKSGYKTYIVGALPVDIEFEKPREQLDAQISYKLLKKRLEIKLNAGNLLNRSSIFYLNTGSYENNPDYTGGTGDISNALRLKPGFTDKYEDGDRVTFSQRFGRTYSTSLTWNF